jgi:hypothetical protein
LQYPAILGSTWQYLEIPGNTWKYLVILGNTRQYLDIPYNTLQYCEQVKKTKTREEIKFIEQAIIGPGLYP